jgi:hypothetical protein
MQTSADRAHSRGVSLRNKLLVAAVAGLLTGGLASQQAQAAPSDPTRDGAAKHGWGSKDGCPSMDKDKDKNGCSSKG